MQIPFLNSSKLGVPAATVTLFEKYTRANKVAYTPSEAMEILSNTLNNVSNNSGEYAGKLKKAIPSEGSPQTSSMADRLLDAIDMSAVVNSNSLFDLSSALIGFNSGIYSDLHQKLYAKIIPEYNIVTVDGASNSKDIELFKLFVKNELKHTPKHVTNDILHNEHFHEANNDAKKAALSNLIIDVVCASVDKGVISENKFKQIFDNAFGKFKYTESKENAVQDSYKTFDTFFVTEKKIFAKARDEAATGKGKTYAEIAKSGISLF